MWDVPYEGAFESAQSTQAEGRNASVKEKLDNTTSVQNAADIVVNALIQRVSKTMPISEGKIDVDRPINSYGVDSLTAVDLRNWIGTEFGHDIAVFEILGGKSFRDVGMGIAKKYLAA